jgi:opacity protein-like surface antigen
MRSLLATGLIIVASVFGISSQVQASQAQTFDITIQVPYMLSEELEFEGGASADLDSDFGFGLGLSFNYTDRFTVVTSVLWNGTDYNATRILDDGNNTPVDISSRLDTYRFNVGGEYYLSDNVLSPFVAAGIGWSWIDSNVASGPPETVCYWDPWLGYICTTVRPTYTENTFTYNAGAGLRYDLNGNNFLKLGYYQTWSDFDNADGSSSIGTIRAELGFKF